MSHVTSQVPSHQVAVSLSSGKLSVNAQVPAYKGAPNPSLLSLLSTGTISLSALNSSYSVSGWGGE